LIVQRRIAPLLDYFSKQVGPFAFREFVNALAALVVMQIAIQRSAQFRYFKPILHLGEIRSFQVLSTSQKHDLGGFTVFVNRISLLKAQFAQKCFKVRGHFCFVKTIGPFSSAAAPLLAPIPRARGLRYLDGPLREHLGEKRCRCQKARSLEYDSTIVVRNKWTIQGAIRTGGNRRTTACYP
jgi:hypothetical protein